MCNEADFNTIPGGVCAAQGFRAAGLHVGVKTHNTNKKDLGLIVSDAPCTAAAMFTRNVVKAAPIHVTKSHLARGKVRAIIANSGEDVRGGGKGHRLYPRGGAGVLHRCDRPDAEGGRD